MATTSDNGKAVTNLLRLDESLYLAHTPYMCEYWFEHKHNIKQMIFRLLTAERMLSFLRVCGQSSLRYNKLMNDSVDDAYNDTVIAPAYQRMEELTGQGDKLLIYEFMDGFYGAIDMIKERENASVATAFDEDQGWFRIVESLEKITGKSEDELESEAESYRTLFLPQMMIYFLRFLHFYDGALEGQDVIEFEERGISQERKQREQCSAKAVQELWSRLAAGDFTTGSPSSSEGAARAPVKIPKPFEDKFLKTAIGEAVDALELTWGEHEKAFLDAWSLLDVSTRENHLADARQLVVNARAGALMPSVMYCPELHPPTLASGNALEQLLRKALRMDDAEYADDEGFLTLLRAYLLSLGQEEMVMSITLMRRTALVLFVELVVRLTLHLPLPQESSPASSSSSSSSSSASSSSSSSASASSSPPSPLPTPQIPTPPVSAPQAPKPNPARPPPSPAASLREDLSVTVAPEPKTVVAGACARCSKPAGSSCSRCRANGRQTLYCSVTCQRADWPTHKLSCQ